MSARPTAFNTTATNQSATSPNTSVYFVDSSLPDLATLLAGLPAGAEVHLIQPGTDGVQLLADTLQGRSGIEAIHLFSHGSAGSLAFGTTSLTSVNLGAYDAQWASIKGALSADADLLIYGCNVAEGDAGAAFVSALAELTGADVAASTDLTGAAALGGDWDLEAQVGPIETATADAAALGAFNSTLAVAHSGTVSGQVFLGGNYIELGISTVGSFGTTVSAPAGFYGTSRSTQVGMSNDADGFGSGTDLRIDYFLPGSPEERWAVGYNGSTSGGYSAKTGSTGAALAGNSVTNTSSGSNLSATFSGTVGGSLAVSQVHSFAVDDKFFKTTVTLTNVSGGTLTDVRFMRSFDPDNTVFMGGNYTTVNKVENTYATSSKAVVSATSLTDAYSTASGGKTAKILFFSSDPRANVANFGFSNSNPYAMPVQAEGYSTTSDSGIAIMFKGGTVAAGGSVTFEYFTSLDTADVSVTIAAIEGASNPAPTFTAFTLPIDTTLEDTPVELTFADLAAQGNQADQMPNPKDPLEAGDPLLVPGTVNAFIVTSVTSGALKIGANAGSATAWNPGTNDVIDASHLAFWTPDANLNGTLNAFKVVARDSDGLKSSTQVQAQVTVTAVNDAPTLASNAALATLAEDPAVISSSTVAALFAPRFADVEVGQTLGGIIVIGNTANAATQGSWEYQLGGT